MHTFLPFQQYSLTFLRKYFLIHAFGDIVNGKVFLVNNLDVIVNGKVFNDIALRGFPFMIYYLPP